MSDTTSPQAASDRTWDALLRKYVSVWVWSILVGVTISVAISFVGVRSGAVRGLFGAALAVPVLLGLAATYGGLMHLLQYLRGNVIPALLSEERVGSDRGTAYHLYSAFRYLIYAIMLRLLTATIEVVFNAFAF